MISYESKHVSKLSFKQLLKTYYDVMLMCYKNSPDDNSKPKKNV